MRFHVILGASMLFGFLGLGSSQTPQSAKEGLLMKRLLGEWLGEIMQAVFTRSDRGGHSNNPDDVHFFLYNNANNPNEFQTLQFHSDDSLKNANWIPDAEFAVLIHGFTQSQNSSMPGVIKNAYLERARQGGRPINVITVDWGQLASATTDVILPLYKYAVENVETCGIRVAELLIKLCDLKIIPSPLKIHIIGFSLGAHVAAQAGNTFYKRKPDGPKVGRITGLDPAGPLFYFDFPRFSGKQLSKTDAEYVDAIHTSWGSYGIAGVVGHSDFFPNRGPNLALQSQPCCVNPLNKLMPLQVCSHNMAPVYYAMTILSPQMSACACNSYAKWKMPYKGCNSRCQATGSSIPWGENLNTSVSFGSYYMAIPEGSFLSSSSPQGDNEAEDFGDRRLKAKKAKKIGGSSSSEELGGSRFSPSDYIGSEDLKNKRPVPIETNEFRRRVKHEDLRESRNPENIDRNSELRIAYKRRSKHVKRPSASRQFPITS